MEATIDPTKCLKCRGCGKVADSEEQEAWVYWEELPLGSDLAVQMGLVKPIPCPECGGTGAPHA
jgi:hypothetical protein